MKTMDRDDCPHLKSHAHDGAWTMTCMLRYSHEECNSNYDDYKNCRTYQYNEKKGG